MKWHSRLSTSVRQYTGTGGSGAGCPKRRPHSCPSHGKVGPVAAASLAAAWRHRSPLDRLVLATAKAATAAQWWVGSSHKPRKLAAA